MLPALALARNHRLSRAVPASRRLVAGIAPSNDRDWQADVAVLPYAAIAGDTVTVHNIRNFDYRSEKD